MPKVLFNVSKLETRYGQSRPQQHHVCSVDYREPKSPDQSDKEQLAAFKAQLELSFPPSNGYKITCMRWKEIGEDIDLTEPTKKIDITV